MCSGCNAHTTPGQNAAYYNRPRSLRRLEVGCRNNGRTFPANNSQRVENNKDLDSSFAPILSQRFGCLAARILAHEE